MVIRPVSWVIYQMEIAANKIKNYLNINYRGLIKKENFR